jgi:hypothetical protein
MSGTVGTVFKQTLKISASLYTSNSTTTSTTVIGTGIGTLGSSTTNVQPKFTASVDSSGNISITPTSGGWDNVDGSLQVGSTYDVVDLGSNQKKIIFKSAAAYQGSGLNGAGLLGADISWSQSSGTVNAFTSITFKAIE